MTKTSIRVFRSTAYLKHAGSNKKSMWLRDRELWRAKRTKIDVCVFVCVCVCAWASLRRSRRRGGWQREKKANKLRRREKMEGRKILRQTKSQSVGTSLWQIAERAHALQETSTCGGGESRRAGVEWETENKEQRKKPKWIKFIERMYNNKYNMNKECRGER